MAQYTVNITNCGASPNQLHVDVGDQVQFCTADTRSYQVTGLGHVFQGSPGRIPVPASECSDYYTVTGAKGRYPYNIEPDCPPEGPPEIIIDN